MFLALAGGFILHSPAREFRSSKRRFQIFMPHARVDKRPVLVGDGARQAGVLGDRSFTSFLQPVAARAQLVLLIFDRFCGW
jgi:hypothetical protein